MFKTMVRLHKRSQSDFAFFKIVFLCFITGINAIITDLKMLQEYICLRPVYFPVSFSFYKAENKSKLPC